MALIRRYSLNRACRQFVAADVFRMVSVTLDLVERYMVLLGLRQPK